MKQTSDFDEKRVILTRLEKHSFSSDPVRCNHFFVIVCNKGEITVEINYSEYKFRENGLLIIKPLDILTLKSGSEDFDCMVLMLPVTAFTPILKEIDIPDFEYVNRAPLTYHSHEYLALIKQIFAALESAQRLLDYNAFEKFAEKQAVSLFYIQHHYYSTCDDCRRNEFREPLSRKKELLRKFIKEIIFSHTMSREVLFYANELGISSGYLNELCNEVSGHSAKDIIDSTVSARLKYELAHTSKSIQEIADEYNFPSQSYFSRYYKRLTGFTPSDFRKGRGRG